MSVEAMAPAVDASSPESGQTTPDNDDPSQSSRSERKNSKVSKPRLSSSQKNNNHKDAENKRRTAIRERFTDLSQIVPATVGQERSEQVMLTRTKDYLQDTIEEIRELEMLAAQQGIPINEVGQMRDNDYGGPQWRQPNLDRYEKAKFKKAAKQRDNSLDDADGEAEDE